MKYIYFIIKLFKQYLLPFTPTKTMLQKTLKRQRDIREVYDRSLANLYVIFVMV